MEQKQIIFLGCLVVIFIFLFLVFYYIRNLRANKEGLTEGGGVGVVGVGGGEAPPQPQPPSTASSSCVINQNYGKCPDFWKSDTSNNCIIPTGYFKGNYQLPTLEGTGINCCLWLDAADPKALIVSSAGIVSKWTDKSPNQFIFSQTDPNTSFNPNNYNILNENNVVTFTKSNKTCLSCKYDASLNSYDVAGGNPNPNANINIGTNSFSLFAVVSFSDATTPGTVFCKSRFGNVDAGEIILDRDTDGKLNGILTTERMNTAPVNETAHSAEWRLLEIIYNRSGSTGGGFYENGVLLSSLPIKPDSSFSNTYDMMLGGYCDLNGHSFGSYLQKNVNEVPITIGEDYKYDINPIVDNSNLYRSYADGKYMLCIFKTDGNFSISSGQIFGQISETQRQTMKQAGFSPSVNPINATVFVVGGGGGGGRVIPQGDEGGGGGGSGMVIGEDVTIDADITYNVFVGKGGGDSASGTPSKIVGGSLNIVAEGGGHGGLGNGWTNNHHGENPRGGGNGWGNWHDGGNEGQGKYSGGAGPHETGGGGGGGMASNGADGEFYGGNGGDGVGLSSFFQDVLINTMYGAGGGGGAYRDDNSKGGIGGSNIGGNGGNKGQPGTSAKPNTGSGGGGGGAKGGNGGSGSDGIVIVAFKKEYLQYDVRFDLASVREDITYTTIQTTPEPSMFFDGQIAEIVGFTSQNNITDNDRYKMQSYLGWKWGIQNKISANYDISNNKTAKQYFTPKSNIGKIKFDTTLNGYSGTDNKLINDGFYDTNTNEYKINFGGEQWKTSGGVLACEWSKWAAENGIVWTGITTTGQNFDNSVQQNIP